MQGAPAGMPRCQLASACLCLHSNGTNYTVQLIPNYFAWSRSSLPTNFDATYAYVLGLTASMLVGAGQTGLMATISNLSVSGGAGKG